MNHYEILGVPKNATLSQIKAAWRKLCTKHHPDRGGDTELMAKINQAYNILIDPVKRARYDAKLHADEEKVAKEAAREAAAKEAAKRTKEAKEAQAKAQQAKREAREEEAQEAKQEQRQYTQAQQFKMDIERLKAQAKLEAERIKAKAKVDAERIKAAARLREREPQFAGQDFGEIGANAYACLCKRCKGRGVITIAHGNGLKDTECPVCDGSGLTVKKAA